MYQWMWHAFNQASAIRVNLPLGIKLVSYIFVYLGKKYILLRIIVKLACLKLLLSNNWLHILRTNLVLIRVLINMAGILDIMRWSGREKLLLRNYHIRMFLDYFFNNTLAKSLLHVLVWVLITLLLSKRNVVLLWTRWG